MTLPIPILWEARKHHQNPLKPFCPCLKFEQLYIAKLIQMLSNLEHMLEWRNKASRPNGTRFGIEQLDQITLKPFLFKCKFEQLYITKLVQMLSNLVHMLEWSNNASRTDGTGFGEG